mmetsp:Transcript_28599/g.62226  ORF Transcript_28599/g.62226 Transcript_28599/m.62226 type:complete len:229 (-) Transcript_28599:721-1407(-)
MTDGTGGLQTSCRSLRDVCPELFYRQHQGLELALHGLVKLATCRQRIRDGFNASKGPKPLSGLHSEPDGPSRQSLRHLLLRLSRFFGRFQGLPVFSDCGPQLLDALHLMLVLCAPRVLLWHGLGAFIVSHMLPMLPAVGTITRLFQAFLSELLRSLFTARDVGKEFQLVLKHLPLFFQSLGNFAMDQSLHFHHAIPGQSREHQWISPFAATQMIAKFQKVQLPRRIGI